MPRTITIDLPLPNAKLHPNGRTRNWRYRAHLVRQARGTAATLAGLAKQSKHGHPWQRAEWSAMFRMPRRRDEDGLVAWLKPYLDGIQDAGIVSNDSGLTIGKIEQVTGKGVGRGVRITIREVVE